MTNQELAQTAAQIYGKPLHFVESVYDYENAPSTIIRCRDEAGETVIVKRANHGEGLMAHEAAGLIFVAGVDAIRGCFPQVMAYDIARRILIMEDLGAEENARLGDILFGEDRELAESALLAMQRAMGHVQAETQGMQVVYLETRASFPAHEPSRHRINRIVEGLRDLPTILNTLGIAPATDFEHDLAEMTGIIEAPGDFLALVHGDFTPANVFYGDGHIRLYDLETHGFGHALLDGSFSVMRYLHSVWARQIPVALRWQMIDAYREALAQGIPAARDDGLFYHHLMACCGGWLAGLCGFITRVLDNDDKWGRTTFRERIVAGLDHDGLLHEGQEHFAAFGETMQRLKKNLRGRWAGVEIQPYPALGQN